MQQTTTILGQASERDEGEDQREESTTDNDYKHKQNSNSKQVVMGWSDPRRPTDDEYYKMMDLQD